ncbi:TPA: hypothetical protein ACU9T0_001534 [Burkholderia cenocepacia]
MEKLAKQLPELPRKNPTRRGIGLAWMIIVAGYLIVSFLDMGLGSPWSAYGLSAPPVVAIGSAIIFLASGEPDVAGGIFLGHVSILGTVIAVAAIVLIYFFSNPPSLVNGWK